MPPRNGCANGPVRRTSRTQKYRDAHVWYDSDKKDNFTAYKLLIADVVDGKLKVVPRGVMAAGGIMDGARGGVDLPRVTSTESRATSRSTTRRWVRRPWERELVTLLG